MRKKRASCAAADATGTMAASHARRSQAPRRFPSRRRRATEGGAGSKAATLILDVLYGLGRGLAESGTIREQSYFAAMAFSRHFLSQASEIGRVEGNSRNRSIDSPPRATIFARP